MSDPARNLIGGRYEIIVPLGKGGMGVVYKAYDPVLDRGVAIKKMASGIVDRDEFRQRFFIEARAVARLNHPNIVTIHELEEYEGDIYIVMEMLEGLPLSAILKQQLAMPLEAQLTMLAQVCSGLDYAHVRGIVHRDIKPANLLLTTTGGVKILDFGIARLASSVVTHRGTMLGTPHYMSPEQINSQDVDARADWFSFGAVTYELVSGVRPFEASSMPPLLMKITSEPHVPLSTAAPGAPLALSTIVDRLLSKDREQRPSNGADVQRALNAAGDTNRQDLLAEIVRRAMGAAGEVTLIEPLSPSRGLTTPLVGAKPTPPIAVSLRTPTPSTPMPASATPSSGAEAMPPGSSSAAPAVPLEATLALWASPPPPGPAAEPAPGGSAGASAGASADVSAGAGSSSSEGQQSPSLSRQDSPLPDTIPAGAPIAATPAPLPPASAPSSVVASTPTPASSSSPGASLTPASGSVPVAAPPVASASSAPSASAPVASASVASAPVAAAPVSAAATAAASRPAASPAAVSDIPPVKTKLAGALLVVAALLLLIGLSGAGAVWWWFTHEHPQLAAFGFDLGPLFGRGAASTPAATPAKQAEATNQNASPNSNAATPPVDSKPADAATATPTATAQPPEPAQSTDAQPAVTTPAAPPADGSAPTAPVPTAPAAPTLAATAPAALKTQAPASTVARVDSPQAPADVPSTSPAHPDSSRRAATATPAEQPSKAELQTKKPEQPAKRERERTDASPAAHSTPGTPGTPVTPGNETASSSSNASTASNASNTPPAAATPDASPAPRVSGRDTRAPLDSESLSAFNRSSGSSVSPAAAYGAESPLLAASVARIKDTLESYSQAIEKQDLETLRSIRDPLPVAETGLAQTANPTSVRFSEVDVHTDGRTATVHARRAVSVGGSVKSSAFVDIHLLRRPTGWVITEIR
jgi:serine/threonine protein kinase